MKRTKTHRGFRLYEFKDYYGVKCSLQASSLAEVSAIWLGCTDFNARRLVQGKGWIPHDIGDVSGDTRMHLTRKEVKALLPKLIAFVESGELP